jgi:VRR-NUC domain
MKEAAIDKRCYEEARLRGGMLMRLRPPPQGVPDRLLLMPGGHVVFVEMKTPTGRVQPGQRDFMKELSRMKVPWRVIRSLDEFVALLDQLERIHLEVTV